MRLDQNSVRAGYAAGRRSMQIALRDAVARERESILSEMAALKAEMLQPYFQMAAELEAVTAELCRLRLLHAQAREQREQIWRDRMFAAAMLTQRDPAQPLN